MIDVITAKRLNAVTHALIELITIDPNRTIGALDVNDAIIVTTAIEKLKLNQREKRYDKLVRRRGLESSFFPERPERSMGFRFRCIRSERTTCPN